MPKIERRPVVYTICVGEKPVVAFSGTSLQEALELLCEDWFRTKLRTKRSGAHRCGMAIPDLRLASLDRSKKPVSQRDTRPLGGILMT
jgi:hypothetical protein